MTRLNHALYGGMSLVSSIIPRMTCAHWWWFVLVSKSHGKSFELIVYNIQYDTNDASKAKHFNLASILHDLIYLLLGT